ncbi:hypothetical protein [Oceaniferula spumae]
MKYILLLLLLAIPTLSQAEDPFGGGSTGPDDEEMVYDFADVHKWDDVVVELGDKNSHKAITWVSTFVASHRGVTGKSQTFFFIVDSKIYEASLKHPDLNRGVVLMSGDVRFPSLLCWLRPLSLREGKANFTVSVSPTELKNMQIAFMPKEGKKRYIYKLDQVALSLKEKAVKKK